jgi:hypothetical protein
MCLKLSFPENQHPVIESNLITLQRLFPFNHQPA